MNICIISVVKPTFTSPYRQDPAGTSGSDKSAHPQAPTHRDTQTHPHPQLQRQGLII